MTAQNANETKPVERATEPPVRAIAGTVVPYLSTCEVNPQFARPA
jgi:hypothetical protein